MDNNKITRKFQIICADCPWDFSDRLSMSNVARGAKANYNTMSITDIKNLKVKDIADPEGCLLALWVPSSLLQEGLDTMKAWGFKHKQTYIWVKTKKSPFISINKIYNGFKKIKSFNLDVLETTVKKCIDNLSINDCLSFGMGRLFRQTHEICLVGINSTNIYKLLNNKSQRSVSFGENLKHSAKPEHLQNSLDIMFSNLKNNKIELFARRQRSGWLCLGNDSPMTYKEDINVSLQKLCNATEKELFLIDKLISPYDVSKDKELFEVWHKIVQ